MHGIVNAVAERSERACFGELAYALRGPWGRRGDGAGAAGGARVAWGLGVDGPGARHRHWSRVSVLV